MLKSWALAKWQNGEIKTVGKPEGQGAGATQRFWGLCIKIGKLEKEGDFFPGKTCELLFVRGTTSFYNKKLQILPVGEGAVWNVQMR